MPIDPAMHKASSPRSQSGGGVHFRSVCMGMLLLEALLALVILIAIVWWTMFAGRRKGELPPSAPPQDEHQPPRS
ncbi:MAG: hypothetical protein RL559_1375 [Pseudomonadota bacterium]